MNISIRCALPGEAEWIDGCYRGIDFVPCGAGDVVVVAEVDGRRAGLGRIVALEDGAAELGGIYVFDAFRGTGLSKRIVAALLDLARARNVDALYCLPFSNLESLYASFGFHRVDDLAGVPSRALDKYRWCAEFYPAPVLLLRLDIR
jgi:N-acetylglutamate synthase-like GNAT family acetyltransferase